MNDQQTLFLILYGIYFATIVSTSGKYHTFDSSAVIAGDKRAALRFAISFLFLNAFPLLYLIFSLKVLRSSTVGLIDSWDIPLLVMIASLGGFALYRFFVGLMCIRRNQNRFFFYSHLDEVPAKISQYAESRQPPDDAKNMSAKYVFIGASLWLFLSLFALFLAN